MRKRDVVWAEMQRGHQMTADLVARLRGIIAAKPPHVTVLADNEEVYPIRVELLREAADKIAQLSSAVLNQNVSILDVHDRAEKAEARLAAAEEYVVHRTRQIDEQNARLADAERVIGRVRTLRMWAGLPVNDERVIAAWEEVRRELNGYEKAYSADVAGTTEQFKQWVLDDLKDPKNFAELKSRSDEANAKMAARPFTDDSNPTGAVGGNILGKAWRDNRLKQADKVPDPNSDVELTPGVRNAPDLNSEKQG